MKRNNLFLGVFFIFIGAFFLLNNLDIINFSIWNALFDLWPLFIVIFGVHLISDKPVVQIVSWTLFFGTIILYAIFKQSNDMPINFHNFKHFF